MSDEPTKYVLRQAVTGIKTVVGEPRVMVSIPHYMEGKEWTTTPVLLQTFDELFEPVSVASENLKQQIRDIIDEHGKYCYIAGANGGEYKGRIALSLADKTKMALELIQRTKE